MSHTNGPEFPASSVPCSTPSAYPANRMGWLHSFCLLLARAEVAREIGRDAALLILIIAIQEDVQRYQAAPIYFDAELQRATGIRSQKQLDRVRQKAVAAGWLNVDRDAAGDSSVARYWTVIPNRLNVFQNPAGHCVVPAQTGLPACEVVDGKERNDLCGFTQQGIETPRPSITPILSTAQILSGSPVPIPLPQAAVPVVAKSQDTGRGVDPKLVPVMEVKACEQVAGKSPQPGSFAGIKMESHTPATSVSNAGTVLQAVEQKKLVAALPVSQDQVISILAAYPKMGDFEMATAEIHRALQKIPYAELLVLVNRYALSRKRPGQTCDQTPTATVWFGRESWKEDPAKWERSDSKR
jgi:hypothetical protein